MSQLTHKNNPCVKDGRYFETGAYRDTEVGKNDYRGYLSPRVLIDFGNYMTKHRVQSDGVIRDSDNWKKGMETKVYLSSLLRHVLDIWTEIENGESRDGMHEALGGAFFNLQGIWKNYLDGDGGDNERR